jgi:hypothetical protein
MIGKRLRHRVARQAQFRCGYCQTQEIVSGVPLTIEHITPKMRGGEDVEANLWLSCRLCNETKGAQIEAIDPETGAVVPLFNPRSDEWNIHFAWVTEGIAVLGLTPVGRATIGALDLNSQFRRASRTLWVEAGYHPPS